MTETKNETNYYFWIIVLLVVMIAAMAGLWVVEHKKLGRAMAFIKVQNQTQQAQDGKLRDMLLNAEVEKNHMLNRDNFAKKSVNINGSPVDVFVVSYSDGVKAGLMEGDIIFVGPLPAESAAPAKKAENKKTEQ